MDLTFEDANGVMVPGTTALREVYRAFHYDEPMAVNELFGGGGPLDSAPCLEAIDNDPTINSLLEAENL